MSAADKDLHVIPLRRVFFGRRANRADRAIRLIERYVMRHYKDAEKVVIDPEVNEYVWSRGRLKPPRRVVVKVKVDPGSKTAIVMLARKA
ncbi:MAG: 50S ribosomal protein L31e [Desulfurococcaceae archaeon]